MRTRASCLNIGKISSLPCEVVRKRSFPVGLFISTIWGVVWRTCSWGQTSLASETTFSPATIFTYSRDDHYPFHILRVGNGRRGRKVGSNLSRHTYTKNTPAFMSGVVQENEVSLYKGCCEPLVVTPPHIVSLILEIFSKPTSLCNATTLTHMQTQ